MKRSFFFKIALSATIALVISGLTTSMLFNVTVEMIHSKIGSDKYYDMAQAREKDKIQEYIDKNQLVSSSINMLDKRLKKSSNKFVGIYINGKLCYTNSKDLFAETIDESTDATTLRLGDTDAELVMFIDVISDYYKLAEIGAAVFLEALFLLLLWLILRPRIKYINTLSGEFRLVADGMYDHAIVPRGKDDLGVLASSAENMRVQLLHSRKDEVPTVGAVCDNITRLSHDIRTPLTSLVGFVDLMRDTEGYKNDSELAHYVTMSREKTARLKTLTDKLFRYSKSLNGTEFAPVTLDGYELFSQFVSDIILELETVGFKVQYTPEVFSGSVSSEPDSLARVCENIEQNIKKYADPQSEVIITCRSENCNVVLNVINSVNNTESNSKDSTGLGLATCQTILSQHGGSFRTATEDTRFITTVTIPLISPES